MLPQIRICVQCKRKFNAFSESQDSCPNCLAKPKRHADPVDPEEVEAALRALDKPEDIVPTAITIKGFTERICKGCQQPFAPTSGVQKWCVPCGRDREIASKKRWADKQAGKITVASTPKIKKLEKEVAETNKKIEKNSAKSYNTQEARSELIIGLLIQLELVTPAQVDKCDKFVMEMRHVRELPEM